MKCPNCGKHVSGAKCKFCGSILPYDSRAVSIKQLLIKLIYIIDTILFPPAKVLFVFWTLCWGSEMITDTSMALSQKLSVILFGYIFFCGIADFVYSRKKKRYIKYKQKVVQRQMNLLQKTMEQYFPYKGLLDEAHKLADIANTTVDEATFQNSYNRLIEIFTELKKYEQLGIFSVSPTEDLNDLLYGRDAATKRFYERKRASDMQYQPVKRHTDSFDNMDGHDFEYYCADILKKNGFSNVEVTQGSGDHGIDILAEKDDITYAIQCKCYSSNIGNAAVQQAHTGKSIYHKDIAVVLTNQYFTTQATEEANALGVKLWDRNKLKEMIATSHNI